MGLGRRESAPLSKGLQSGWNLTAHTVGTQSGSPRTLLLAWHIHPQGAPCIAANGSHQQLLLWKQQKLPPSLPLHMHVCMRTYTHIHTHMYFQDSWWPKTKERRKGDKSPVPLPRGKTDSMVQFCCQVPSWVKLRRNIP